MTTETKNAPIPTCTRWDDPGAAHRYVGERWSSKRRRNTDPRLVAGILARHLPPVAPFSRGHQRRQHRVLDAPCGAGRLREAIERSDKHYFGLDVSTPMLAEAGAAGAGPLLRADVLELPFRAGSFDAVVCCRLLHHVTDGPTFERTVAELVRVSSGLVVASFWDAGSLPALRRRILPALGGRGPRRRVAHKKSFVRRAFERAGAHVVEFRHSFPFMSRQTFAVAVRR